MAGDPEPTHSVEGVAWDNEEAVHGRHVSARAASPANRTVVPNEPLLQQLGHD